MSRVPRVAVFSELPTPYRWPVFQRLLDRDDLDLRIFFCARSESDREWSFDFRPDERVRFLPVTTLSFLGSRTVHYHVNPTVFGELSGGRFDAVVFPGYAMFASQAGALWCRATRTPYVIFSETTHLGNRRRSVVLAKRLLLPVLIGGASAWLATGTLSKRYLASYGAEKDRVFFFPNSPDVDDFRAKSEAAETVENETPVLLFVARLIGVKRCDLLIRAAGLLRDRGVPVRVVVAGDGVERNGLDDLTAELGLSGVEFLGNVGTDDLPALYASADVFVLPSDHEPWGAVVGEAMACGLPIVVSDRVASGVDLVSDANGAVFRNGDATALADVLEGLLSDRARLRKMGARSGERIEDFSHSKCADAFVRAIRAAIAEGS